MDQFKTGWVALVPQGFKTDILHACAGMAHGRVLPPRAEPEQVRFQTISLSLAGANGDSSPNLHTCALGQI